MNKSTTATMIIAIFLASQAYGQDQISLENECNELVLCYNKPNIIFLLADDQRDNTFAAMGHPFVKTPNVDKLVQQGVRFSNTYIAEPVCSPSRASIFTGMHERLHGVGFSSSYILTEEQWEKTYPAILRENGYFTGFIGKFGVESYDFRGKASEKFDFWYGHDGWTKFFPKESDEFSCLPYHNAKNDIITPIMGEGIHRFLDTVPIERPFCLSLSFNVPHGSQTTSMYTGYKEWHSMQQPANENPKLKGNPFYDMLYRNLDFNISSDVGTDPYQYIPKFILDQDKGRNKVYDYDYSKENNREHYIRYYQTISGMDNVIGDLLESLKKHGLEKNTVIIFASDHGLLMGEYGMGGKGLLYDLTEKIPCFVYDPRLPDNKRGRIVDKLVSSLDLPVTLLDYAGIEAPQEMTGRSLVSLVEAQETEWRKELFLESLFTLRDNPFCEGIRVENWKYIRMYDGVAPYDENDLDFKGRKPEFEQLFNLDNDPDEKVNLIGEYESTQFLDSLRRKVADYSDNMNISRKEYQKNHFVFKKEK
jgi:arylsulfatase A-like enzyme